MVLPQDQVAQVSRTDASAIVTIPSVSVNSSATVVARGRTSGRPLQTASS